MAAVANEIERGKAVVIAGNSFAVDDAGPRAQACQRLDDQREATGEVITWTAVEPHLRASLAGNNAEAVVLDLVQPLAAGRQLIGFGWETRRDESGRRAATCGTNKIVRRLLQLHHQKPAFFCLGPSRVGGEGDVVVTSPGPLVGGSPAGRGAH